MNCCFSLLLFMLLFSFPWIPFATKHSNSSKILLLPPSEAELLYKIMDSVSGDKLWRISYPNPCTPVSSWRGVECKTGHDNLVHVSRLDFGTFPYPTCKKTATFPCEIFTLPYLESVFFFKCFTHYKTTLSVFPNTFSKTSLEQLSLRSNPALVGQIPSQIVSLKSIKILTLSQNHLTGPIPIEIFILNSLVHLDLSYNILSGTIPHQVGNLKNLVVLDLSFNALAEDIPDTIGELGLLQKLDLSSNFLTGGIPESIEKLNSLAFIALSSNKLKGSFPKGLEKLQNLQYLIMDDNPMNATLPAQLGKLVKLQELRLANSGYIGSIPSEFSQLSKMTTLDLENNRLTGEIPLGLGSLPQIYHLNLSRNMLVGAVPFNSSFFSRLGRNLDLSKNPGLCLSPSESSSYRTGTGTGTGLSLCGSKKQALSKSQATCCFSKPFLNLLYGLLLSGINLIEIRI